MKHRDEIDKWLYEELQLIPGSCSSISALQYNTARAVAEKLWPVEKAAARLAEAVLFDWDNKVDIAWEVAKMTTKWDDKK